MDADNAGNIKEYRYLREEFDKLKYDLPYNDNLNDEHDIKRYKPKPGIVIASRFQRNVDLFYYFFDFLIRYNVENN